jgi:hypothetical protein
VGSRLRSVLITLVMTVVSMIVVLLPASPANAATCGSSPTWFKVGSQDGIHYVNAVNLRTGPFTTCAIKKVGYWGHVVKLRCKARGTTVWHNGVPYYDWTFAWHVDYQMNVWITNAYLGDHGRNAPVCDAPPPIREDV